MAKLTEKNQWTLQFEAPGTFIEWKGKKFMVIKWIDASKGVVQEVNEDPLTGKVTFGNIFKKFYWYRDGEKAKLSK
jgi:hypothetical protein